MIYFVLSLFLHLFFILDVPKHAQVLGTTISRVQLFVLAMLCYSNTEGEITFFCSSGVNFNIVENFVLVEKL